MSSKLNDDYAVHLQYEFSTFSLMLFLGGYCLHIHALFWFQEKDLMS
jgi:hypothetical protein